MWRSIIIAHNRICLKKGYYYSVKYLFFCSVVLMNVDSNKSSSIEQLKTYSPSKNGISTTTGVIFYFLAVLGN